MASSPVTAPFAPSQDSDSSPPAPPTTNSSSLLSPPPNSTPLSPPPPSPSPPSPSPPHTPPSSPPPTSPPPSPPTSPPPSSPPPVLSSPPPHEPSASSPPPPAQPESPPSQPESPPAQAIPSPPLASPPPASAIPLPFSPPIANPTPPSNEGGATPLPIFSPPPPVSDSSPIPPSSSSTLSPPPPSHAPPHKPPSSSDASSGSRSSPSSDSSFSNTAIIAGASIAGLVILAFLIVFLTCSRRKKKRPYSMEPAFGPKGEYWHSPQPMDHLVKLPPPPGMMGTPVGGGGGRAPPPPIMTSSEYSSGFSGQHHGQMPPASPNMSLGFNHSQFSYEQLAIATGGFSQGNLLGQGGFGYVHKGVLADGKEIAVKSLKSGSGQGEREFQAEVEIISRVHHRHLVSLVGYCIADGQRMLVYEFVPNKTLEFHLHGKGQPVMDWAARLRIAMGSAKGLAYLHEDCHPRIIHRDIKTANILIDNNWEAMVADFGLAKLSSDNYTHVSTRVMGTFGYLAPEYASSGKLTEKSDVFSFGVMLLELITGRRPVDPSNKFMEDSLVDWARPLLTKALEDGNYNELVDPRLEDNFVPHEMARMVACASSSIRHSARRRPKMSQIARALEGDSSMEDLNGTGKPIQSSGINTNGTTQSYDTGAYNADMMKFRNMVMSSQEIPSSEFGDTSEYGLNPSSSSSNDSREIPTRQKL